MQNFRTLRQPLLGELAMSPERKTEREKNAICSGHLSLCQQPRAAHALRSDQKIPFIVATYVYASSQGQRTHSARINFLCSSRGLRFMLFDGAAIPCTSVCPLAHLPARRLPILVSYSETRSCWLVCGQGFWTPLPTACLFSVLKI